MKKMWLVCGFVMCAMIIAPLMAVAAGGPGPVKISTMTRVESHTKVSDTNNGYSGQMYAYNMISATRQLQKNVLGNLYYLNQYDIDEERVSAHIGGVTLIRLFSKKWIGTFGYTYSSNPGHDVLRLGAINDYVELDNSDKFSVSMLYNINPKSKCIKYSLYSAYGTTTGLNAQKAITEKLDATFPIFSKRFTGNAGYAMNYSLDTDANGDRLGQLTNQYTANLTYATGKSTKVALGYLFVDKMYGSAPDDQVGRLSLLHNFR